MLCLPLVINNVILKVNINFKDIDIRKNILNSKAKDITSSDIVVGKVHLKAYEDNNKIMTNPKMITSFVRKNINYNNEGINFIEVNTKNYKDKDFYDTYIIPAPSYNENEINDYIYGLLINSIRLSRPDNIKRKDLSLAEIGFDELFNGEFYSIVERAKNNNQNFLYIRNQLINAGFRKQVEVLDFFNNLNYDISENSEVILASEFDSVKAFFTDNEKMNKFLNNYRDLAVKNSESFMNLVTFNNLVNGRSLMPMLSSEQQKKLIKKLNSNGRAA